MTRRKGREHGNKVQVSTTLDPELYAWIDERIGSGREFASVSHALERGIRCLMEKEG